MTESRLFVLKFQKKKKIGPTLHPIFFLPQTFTTLFQLAKCIK